MITTIWKGAGRAAVAAAVMTTTALAQDVTGRWEGVIRVPDQPVDMALDISRDAAGKLVVTFTRAGTNIRWLPLVDVSQSGRSLKFTLRAGTGGGTFVVDVAEDLKTLAGVYNTAEGGHSIPLDAARTGAAQLEPPLRNAAVPTEYVGNWTGALEVGAAQVPLALSLVNAADGASRGVLKLTQRAGVEVGAGIALKGAELTLTFRMIGATFVGRLNAAQTELGGTYSGDGVSYPLTFRRAAP